MIDNSTPSFTEPYWRDIGVKIYPKAGYTVEVVTTVIGVTLAAVRFVFVIVIYSLFICFVVSCGHIKYRLFGQRKKFCKYYDINLYNLISFCACLRGTG